MTFDPTKPVQTRDGRSARILCTDLKDRWPIVAAITRTDGTEYSTGYAVDGKFTCRHQPERDLINVPEKRTVWVNVYPDDCLKVHETESRAEVVRTSHCIACVPLTYTVGEGL
jgi:hypothetical protein